MSELIKEQEEFVEWLRSKEMYDPMESGRIMQKMFLVWKAMSETPSKEQAIATWKERVFDKHNEVDPSAEELWSSVAIGFALGLGYKPEQARELMWSINNAGLL
jgi:hypothetical protein